ncbi:MAG: prolyl oligopeptidase family serine peptidase [Pirellula sp.]|jgi:dipeptidyl aminopeptidase/acylaminoacyl peptidase|nr:prolyl oligopeptidase family serine peptidase [Pirellula sp.]
MKTFSNLFVLLVVLSWTTTRLAPVHAQQDKFSVKPDIVYGHKDGMALTYDVITPTKNAKGIGLIFMVSGGWVSTWIPAEQMASTLFAPLLNEGYTILPVRHGSSPKYVVPEIVSDVKLALKHIAENASEHQINKDKLGVFGFSAGGHLSLILGTQTNDVGDAASSPRVAAVAAVFPPTDLGPYVAIDNPIREQFPALKFDPKKADQFSPLKHVSKDDAPTFLIHGDKDELVPIWHSEKIEQELKANNVPTEFVVIKDAGHGFDGEGNKRLYAGMLAWFEKHLK